MHFNCFAPTNLYFREEHVYSTIAPISVELLNTNTSPLRISGGSGHLAAVKMMKR